MSLSQGSGEPTIPARIILANCDFSQRYYLSRDMLQDLRLTHAMSSVALMSSVKCSTNTSSQGQDSRTPCFVPAKVRCHRIEVSPGTGFIIHSRVPNHRVPARAPSCLPLLARPSLLPALAMPGMLV